MRLDADVLADEIEHLVDQSYEPVCSKLTRKQKAELTVLSTEYGMRREKKGTLSFLRSL